MLFNGYVWVTIIMVIWWVFSSFIKMDFNYCKI